MLKRQGKQLFRSFLTTPTLIAALLAAPAVPAALLGVAPGLPLTSYNNTGMTSFTAATGVFSVSNAQPLGTLFPPLRSVFNASAEPKSVNINIVLDASGALIGGVSGDDLVVIGAVDTTGDSVLDADGVLLTGEVTAFGSRDSGGPTDSYDFRFTVTGGALAAFYAGQDIGVTLTSEGSNFTGNFAADFGGAAKGNFGPIPGIPNIDIEKLTNDFQADDPNGTNPDGEANDSVVPQVAIGNLVDWEYRVTNTGNVLLDPVVVSDDQGATVSCPLTALEPGESMICTATDFADDLTNTVFTTVPGLCGGFPNTPMYENKGKAVGTTSNGDFVEDEDASHYCNPPGPDIDIEKLTNDFQADDPNGTNPDGEANDSVVPQVAIGNAVSWEYRVTNTGNVLLDPVVVSDDQGATVSCPLTALEPGESMICTAMGNADDLTNTVFTTVPGLCGGFPNTPMYENKGKAVGTTSNGDFVEDEDASHYCNPPGPDIDIEKLTNDFQADDPNGTNPDGEANDSVVPQVAIGNAVSWEYRVTNTGDVLLDPVVVSDDQGATVSCPLTALEPGESMICTAMGNADDLTNTVFTTVPGLCGGFPNTPMYENKGKAVGTTSNGDFVEDEDASHYCNPPGPDIDIEKLTNDFQADDPNGTNPDGEANDSVVPQVAIGNAVDWEYRVTNTGNVLLDPVVVSDDQGATVSCPLTALEPGESMICTAMGNADDLTNTVFTTVPGLCGGFPNTPMYENKGKAVGTTSNGDFVEDEDASHYCNPPGPDIDIEKLTNDFQADDPNGTNPDGEANDSVVPQVAIGNAVSWEYRVTNTGNVLLDPVVVSDDQGATVSCPLTALEPGESMICTAMGNADDLTNTVFTTVPGLCGGFPNTPMYENKGKAVGTTSNGDFVEDEDASHYCNPPGPDIDIEKLTNDFQADDPNGTNPDGEANDSVVPQVAIGNAVSWEYRVTNTGNVLLDPVVVSDDQGATVSCPLTALEPGESMICTATDFADDLTNTVFTTVPGLCGGFPNTPMYENKGKAVGTSTNGDFVEDEDASHYCNPPGPDIDIEKLTNGFQADGPNGTNPDGEANDSVVPQVVIGNAVDWEYRVTNTGNVLLDPVVVSDDQGATVSCPLTALEPGESMICTATDFADDLSNTVFTTVPGLCGGFPNTPTYENKGKAVGTTSNGDFVEDEDASHYCNPPPPPSCDVTVSKTCLIAAPPVSSLPGKCSGKLKEVVVIWDGAGTVNVTAGNGVSSLSAASVAHGDELKIVPDGSTNDVFINIANMGESKFHVSCSDRDMNADSDNDVQQQLAGETQDCGKFQGDAKSNGDPDFINTWLLEGLTDADDLTLDCTDSSPDFPVEPVQCAYTPAPPTPGLSCSDIKDITELTMVWDGADNVTVTPSTGVTGVSPSTVNNGDVMTIGVANGAPNDIFINLTGGASGQSKFHISCSDDDMNAEDDDKDQQQVPGMSQDCGKNQGNAKSTWGFVNDWLYAGMAGEGGVITCPNMPGGAGDSVEVVYGITVDNPNSEALTVNIVDTLLGIDETEVIPANGSFQLQTDPVLVSPDGTGTDPFDPDVYKNTVVVTGSTAGGASCQAEDAVEVKRNPPPPEPPLLGKCSGKLQEVVVIWNGDGDISVTPGNGASSVSANLVSPGDVLTVFADGSTNDVFIDIDGVVSGESKFHVSCSDGDMNADSDNDDQQQLAGETQDCGKYQGNAKSTSGFINEWLLEGMLDADGLRLTCNFDPANAAPGGGGPGPGPSGDVSGAAQLDLGDDKKAKWELTNNGSQDVFITRVVVTWPPEHQKLKKFKLAGDFAKDVNDTSSPTAVPDDKAFESDPNKRKLKAGETKKLEIEFDKDFDDHEQGDYTISVEFDDGQVITFN